jgi:hypothetical protein
MTMICRDTTRGVGSFLRAIKKIGLAANKTLLEFPLAMGFRQYRRFLGVVVFFLPVVLATLSEPWLMWLYSLVLRDLVVP